MPGIVNGRVKLLISLKFVKKQNKKKLPETENKHIFYWLKGVPEMPVMQMDEWNMKSFLQVSKDMETDNKLFFF